MSAEDQMIAKITLHRDIKERIIQILQQSHIPCQETPFTDPNGDIMILNPNDTATAKHLIRHIRQTAHP